MAESERILARAAQRPNDERAKEETKKETVASASSVQEASSASSASTAAGEEVLAAIRDLGDNGPGVSFKALGTVSKLLTNIVNNPNEAKYRRLKLSNAALNSKVISVVGGVALLEAVGFLDLPGEDTMILLQDADIGHVTVSGRSGRLK